MKYIKSFYESKFTFQKIDQIEWKNLSRHRIQITTNYPDILSQIRVIFGLPKVRPNSNWLVENYSVRLIQDGKRIVIENNKRSGHDDFCDIGIDVLEDEWFLVHVYNPQLYLSESPYIFFKCDQLDELFDLLLKIKEGSNNYL